MPRRTAIVRYAIWAAPWTGCALAHNMNLEQSPHRGFDVAKQLSMAVASVGVLLLVEHFAGQLTEGWAPGWTLIMGGACFICGVILSLLFMILVRLERIDQQLLRKRIENMLPMSVRVSN